jgi:hypothetical protein
MLFSSIPPRWRGGPLRRVVVGSVDPCNAGALAQSRTEERACLQSCSRGCRYGRVLAEANTGRFRMPVLRPHPQEEVMRSRLRGNEAYSRPGSRKDQQAAVSFYAFADRQRCFRASSASVLVCLQLPDARRSIQVDPQHTSGLGLWVLREKAMTATAFSFVTSRSVLRYSGIARSWW